VSQRNPWDPSGGPARDHNLLQTGNQSNDGQLDQYLQSHKTLADWLDATICQMTF
jgi:hypothetical protein